MVLKQEAATRLGGGFLSLQRSQRPRLRQDVKRIILSLLDSFPHKSFACGERRPAKQNKLRLAAGVAPVQVAFLSVFGNYKKHLRHCYTLFGAIRGSRAHSSFIWDSE